MNRRSGFIERDAIAKPMWRNIARKSVARIAHDRLRLVIDAGEGGHHLSVVDHRIGRKHWRLFERAARRSA